MKTIADDARTTTESLVGYRFKPTDQELVLHYLNNKIYKKPLPSDDAVIECDLYGEEGEVWSKIFQETGEKVFYFFTKLRKLTKKDSHIARCIGSGSWKYQKDKKIYSYYPRIGSTKEKKKKKKKMHIGCKRNFCFVPKERFNPANGRWVMHEYWLDGCLIKNTPNNLLDEYVICCVKKVKERQPRNATNSDVVIMDSNSTTTQPMETATIEGFTNFLECAMEEEYSNSNLFACVPSAHNLVITEV